MNSYIDRLTSLWPPIVFNTSKNVLYTFSYKYKPEICLKKVITFRMTESIPGLFIYLSLFFSMYHLRRKKIGHKNIYFKVIYTANSVPNNRKNNKLDYFTRARTYLYMIIYIYINRRFRNHKIKQY